MADPSSSSWLAAKRKKPKPVARRTGFNFFPLDQNPSTMPNPNPSSSSSLAVKRKKPKPVARRTNMNHIHLFGKHILNQVAEEDEECALMEEEENDEENPNDALVKAAWNEALEGTNLRELLAALGSSNGVVSENPSFVGAGLANLGNSCFLNAVMQCFTHSVLLLQGLYSLKHQTPCDCSNERFCLICALREQVEHSLTSSGKAVFPRKLVENLSYFSSSFRSGQQEDAHEFLQSFLNRLESALPSETDNLVKQVFGGSVISKLRCCSCNHISDTYEPSVDLSLEIDAATSLVTALESFTKVEHIEEITCDQCKEKVSVDKQLLLDQIPPVCAFHLKRFKNDGSQVEKIDKHLDFPLELDLQPYTCGGQTDKVALKYDLHAVVVHTTLTASFGHYYCFIRSAPHKWHKFDDDEVTSVSEACVQKEQAYLLFYAKEGTPSFASFMEAYKPSLPHLSKTSPQSVMENVEHTSTFDSDHVLSPQTPPRSPRLDLPNDENTEVVFAAQPDQLEIAENTANKRQRGMDEDKSAKVEAVDMCIEMPAARSEMLMETMSSKSECIEQEKQENAITVEEKPSQIR